MSVTNGQNADATTLNTAFVSKTTTGTESVAGVLELANGSSGNTVTNVQQDINDIKDELDESTFTVANNVGGATDVTGLLVSSASNHGAEVRICLRRRDDTEERMSIGKLFLVYLQDAGSWEIEEDLNANLDDGVTFSVTAAGQVQYTSDNMAGANYFGELKFKVSTFGTFSN